MQANRKQNREKLIASKPDCAKRKQTEYITFPTDLTALVQYIHEDEY